MFGEFCEGEDAVGLEVPVDGVGFADFWVKVLGEAIDGEGGVFGDVGKEEGDIESDLHVGYSPDAVGKVKSDLTHDDDVYAAVVGAFFWGGVRFGVKGAFGDGADAV